MGQGSGAGIALGRAAHRSGGIALRVTHERRLLGLFASLVIVQACGPQAEPGDELEQTESGLLSLSANAAEDASIDSARPSRALGTEIRLPVDSEPSVRR